MKRLLIDAAHADESRVALLDGTRLEDFETETAGKQQLKGNIYLGHVSRVEPSLQAAFITYGGNRNGFLAFGEVHPQFFALSDKEKKALLKETEDQAARRRGKDGEEDNDVESTDSPAPEATAESTDEVVKAAQEDGGSRPKRVDGNKSEGREERRQPGIHRRYRIQDVLKEGQKVLVQVVKEERGSKGAALTTYFSLPGRYTVLMPNTPHAGGISRKISDPEERQALKEAYGALKVPSTMGLIIRTAGVGQPAAAIKKDYANLLNLWASINESFAGGDDIQCLHEDGSLIIRALRDMNTDELEEILISGKRALKTAKDFAKSMVPDCLKLIKEYKDETPLFAAFKVEQKLGNLFHTRVPLPSGGSMVINPTEALVAVDINSGRATQERGIEETALKTNLEACEELTRQIRLRDLAGLIVVDFIDMEDYRNVRKVENAMRKALRKDRARIQFGRISEFGLMEISRQRLRPSYGESHMVSCPHCLGTGHVHSPATAGLIILRKLEEEDIRKADRVIVTTSPDLVVWLFNHKREAIGELEAKYKYQIQFKGDAAVHAPDHRIELINIKADGTESKQTIDVVLREQPELPPELRQQRGRRRGKDENGEREERRREPREARDEKREDREESREGGREGSRDGKREGRRGRGRDRDRDNKPEAKAEESAEGSGNARRPSRIGAERSESKDDKPEGRAEKSRRPEKVVKAEKAAAEDKPAKPVKEAKDEPLAAIKVEVDNDAPTILPSAKRRTFSVVAEPDTDAEDVPLQVQKQSEGKSSDKADNKSAKPARAPKEAKEKPEAAAKPGSILSRLLTRKDA